MQESRHRTLADYCCNLIEKVFIAIYKLMSYRKKF